MQVRHGIGRVAGAWVLVGQSLPLHGIAGDVLRKLTWIRAHGALFLRVPDRDEVPVENPVALTVEAAVVVDERVDVATNRRRVLACDIVNGGPVTDRVAPLQAETS